MLKLKDVKISAIGHPLFLTRFSRDDRPLETSIKNYGILNPPRLLRQDKKFLIIDGFARIESAKRMGNSSLNCLVYEQDEIDKKNAFLLCLELNRWTREFNLVEKAFCLKTADEIFGGLNIPDTFFQRVDIKQNIRTIHQYKDLLKLPTLIQKYAVNNRITLTVILGFLRFPKQDIERLASQLFIFPLNQNKLAEILGLLIDIAKRDEMLPSRIMEEVMSEIEHEYNVVKKEQKLRHTLHKRRNPQYESQMSEFKDKVSNLPIDEKTKISPAPFFEDDYIEINTTISSQKELEAFKNSLENDSWQDLFKKSGPKN